MRKLAALLGLMGLMGVAQASALNGLTQLYIKEAGLDRLTAVLVPTADNKVLIDGKAMLVGGSSICPVKPLPDSTGIWVVGMSDTQYAEQYAGHVGCAVIGPKAASVHVVLYGKFDGHVIRQQETWSVQRGLPNHADAVVLKRANGQLVTAAE